LNKETKCFMEVEIGVGMYVGGDGRESVWEQSCVYGPSLNQCILFDQWLKLMSPSWTNKSIGPG
jgi:hypothetical protein